MLSELIEAKTKDVNDITSKHQDAESRASDLMTSLEVRRTAYSDLSNWTVRFDQQETMEKKAMLLNLIENIIIYDGEIDVNYGIRFDDLLEEEYNETG
ncbi:MAG: hypothetical protein LBU04_01490 [Christensenellaceae bacterium]|nr:hypothetical protein [Christensenellaceae bacterium]